MRYRHKWQTMDIEGKPAAFVDFDHHVKVVKEAAAIGFAIGAVVAGIIVWVTLC